MFSEIRETISGFTALFCDDWNGSGDEDERADVNSPLVMPTRPDPPVPDRYSSRICDGSDAELSLEEIDKLCEIHYTGGKGMAWKEATRLAKDLVKILIHDRTQLAYR